MLIGVEKSSYLPYRLLLSAFADTFGPAIAARPRFALWNGLSTRRPYQHRLANARFGLQPANSTRNSASICSNSSAAGAAN